jgi:hypothetical protein
MVGILALGYYCLTWDSAKGNFYSVVPCWDSSKFFFFILKKGIMIWTLPAQAAFFIFTGIKHTSRIEGFSGLLPLPFIVRRQTHAIQLLHV